MGDEDKEEIQVEQEIIDRKPVTPSALVRPPLNTPLLKIVPDVVPALKVIFYLIYFSNFSHEIF